MQTNLHAMFATNEVKEEDGVEVPLGEGISITVRSFKSKKVFEANRRIRKQYAHLTRKGTLPDHIAEEIALRLLCEAVVVGWKGIIDEAGAEVPYSPEACRALLTDLKHLRDELAAKAMDFTSFQDELDEAALGN